MKPLRYFAFLFLVCRFSAISCTLFAATGSSSGETWSYNPFQWTLQDGNSSFLADGHGVDFSIMQSAPISARVTIEADVEVSEVFGKDWKVAGVAIVRDTANYWQFALIQSPDGMDLPNRCELAEMRDNIWHAQRELRETVREGTSDAWEPGRRCHLRLSMNPEGIEAVMSDAEGNVLHRIGYAFQDKTVASGRPALKNHGFVTAFTNVACEHSSPVTIETAETAAAATPYDSKSFVAEVSGEKTGFFHVEKRNGISWVIDPLGRGFVPLGVDHASYHVHFCEQLGYAPYCRKNEANYAGVEEWSRETIDRLQAWGFNLLGAGCMDDLRHRGLAHTEFLSIGRELCIMKDEWNILPDRNIPGSGFPNVFHPRFEEFCRYFAGEHCRRHVQDPWLFGYFLDNELDWWGSSFTDSGLFDATMRKSADHSAKIALRDFLAQRYQGEISRFNQAWGVDLGSFDEILQRNELAGPNDDAVKQDKKDFIGLIAERYFGTIRRAVREADPHHMILGCRFAGGICSEGVWRAAGKNCDIVTFNYYGNVDLDRGIARDHFHSLRGRPLVQEFQDYFGMCQAPMMVTEWSFPALDAGLPSIHGAGQRFRTQAERTRATEITARTMLSLPFLVGYDYFMWVDEPALGISKVFPEDSNYGLVNEDGRPYELLTAMFTQVHRESGQLRLAGVRPSDIEACNEPPRPSTLAVFLERRSALTNETASKHPKLHFQRQADEYAAGNGVLEIRGRVGNETLTTQVLLQGEPLGMLNGMMMQYDGIYEWVALNRVLDVQARVDDDAMTVDLTGAFETTPDSRRRSYEAGYRFVFLPERNWFTVQWLWIRNTDSRPMALQKVFFQTFSRLGGTPEGDAAASIDAVPRLWGNAVGDAWIDKGANIFFGLAAGDLDPVRIDFITGDMGDQHPDARYDFERTIAPGETVAPPTPTAVVCIAGRGDRHAWEREARKAIDEITRLSKE